MNTAPVTPLVAPPVNRYVLRLLNLLKTEGTLGNAEILTAFNLKSGRWLRETYLAPALSEELIAYTLSEKPASRLQQYCIITKGKAALAKNKK